MYDPVWTNEARFEEARRLAQRYARKPLSAPATTPRADPARRLRIGYLSSDFRNHPVVRNIEPLLVHRDRERFEVVAYAEVRNPDGVTTRLQGLFDQWRSTIDRTDEDVAAQIRADGVDILVTLAGHLDENRLLVCGYRPAPVQVSLYDVATSGFDEVDYLLTDRTICPRKPAEKFTERVIRLPTSYVYAPMRDGSPVGPSPARGHGAVTFGSFNNPTKLNGATLALWGQILKSVPGSRLILKFHRWFQAADLQARVRTAFSAVGVEADRIEYLSGDEPLADHLQTYSRIDIALDTYPFGGATTTFEALWMGVPVVTLVGDTMVSRCAASMLRAVKLDSLVTDSPGQYIAAAVALAADRERLAGLRASLRERVMGSPLVDGRAHARRIERVYRAIWTRWCRSHLEHREAGL